MALRVTASIVGLTTSRDEKSSPVLLDMVAKKTVLSYCLQLSNLQQNCSEAVRRGEREYDIALKEQ